VEITLENAGKKYITEWILRKVNLRLVSGNGYAFVGANGSGKSTLIKIISGQLPTNEGDIRYRVGSKEIHIDDWYRFQVLAAPYLELVEEFSLEEMVAFHSSFKPFKASLSVSDFIDFAQLSHAKHKLVRHFSSGMKQRLRLALAFQTDVPVVFLDEPTSNLDRAGADWYNQHVTNLLDSDQIVIVGSNQPQEYTFCESIVTMGDYKN
jgi:ABC-type multidrug transport system ATPase subunit